MSICRSFRIALRLVSSSPPIHHHIPGVCSSVPQDNALPFVSYGAVTGADLGVNWSTGGQHLAAQRV